MATNDERETSQSDREQLRALVQKRRVSSAERREIMLALVVAGYEPEFIAQRLEVSRATVRRGIRQSDRRVPAPRRPIAKSTRNSPNLEGVAAIERHHGPTVPAPPRHRPPQLSSIERGGKFSCAQSLENTQNRKIHETAPGAVDDALEHADLNTADPPLAGDGAIGHHHGPRVAALSRSRSSQLSSLQSLENTQNRERISI